MLKTTQTGICFRANVFIYIEAILARKQLHRGIFRAKILKILKTVKKMDPEAQEAYCQCGNWGSSIAMPCFPRGFDVAWGVALSRLC